ncbi:MAG: tRNA pseudouridine(38-40) synthase TruA [Lachnospiraceae bacterium]|nr:tRNA pseudouridine(38-40) synthase TruA [Lachnospiraceae bacterium]
MKQNYRFEISYDGTRYLGWEHQPGTDMTIQGKIERVLSKMVGIPDEEPPVEVLCAGRTDAGVHALCMVANAKIETDLSEDEIRDYMNRYLPDDICINDVKIAGERFHARYNAIGKTYRYTCYGGKRKPVFDRKYVYTLDGMPDIEKMKKAASYLMGEHDFAAFCANPRMKKSTVRNVDMIDIVKKDDYVIFTYHGSGFLQHMVRILTGTLLEVGFGKRSPENMLELLERGDRKEAGVTAPAQGLTMVKVDYH